MRTTMAGIVLGGLLFCVACEEAPPTGTWRQLETVGPTPPRGHFATLVDAPAMSRETEGEASGLFVIGGASSCPGESVTSDIWRWDRDQPEELAGEWVEDDAWDSSVVLPVGGFYDTAAAFDPNDEKLLVFGGFQALSPDPLDCETGRVSATDHFYIRDPETGWENRSGASSNPTPRGGAVMFYDVENSQVRLFGGRSENGVHNDIYAWNGEAWTSPEETDECELLPEMNDYTAAYDPYRKELILVAAVQHEDGLHSNTWGLTDRCWSDYGEAGEPPQPWTHTAMTFDPGRGRLVLVGGSGSNVHEFDANTGVWEWDGWEWMSITSPAPAVWGAALGAERTEGAVMLFGSVDDGSTNERQTWIYEGPPIPSRYGCQSATGLEVGLAFGLLALLALPRRWRKGLLLLALLGPATLRAEEPRKIAYLGMLNTNGVEATDAETISGVLQTFLGQGGKNKVIGPSDIKAMLGLEGQKQLMGCEADSSCLAELGGALGARHAAYADLNKLGSTAVFNLTLLDVENTEVVSRISRTVKLTDTLEPVLDLLEGAVSDLFRPLAEETAATATPPDPVAPPEVETPAVTPPPSEKAPMSFATISEGLYLQVRGDVDLFREGGMGGGFTLGWGRYLVGPQVTLIGSAPVILRIEARLAPVALGPVHPYLSAGIAFSNPALGPRAALGAELRFGGFLLFFEGALEEYLLNQERLQTRAILVAGGVGWRL